MLEYRGLKGTLERLIVSDRQVDRQIEQLIEQNPHRIPVTDRPSRMGDELVLDYAGYVDGEQFEGGTAENQLLVLGSDTFIPGFEAQLAGRNAGAEVDVHVVFPEQYHAAHLAGKPAVFKCKIREIRVRETYAPDDAFAREVAGLASFRELRERLREGLQAYSDRQAEADLRASLLDQLADRYGGEVTQEQLNRAADAQIKGMEAQLARQGLTLDAYCQFMSKTREQLREDCMPDARRAVIRQRIISDIARQEHIEADEESVAAAIRDLCEENGMTVEQLTHSLDEAAQNAIVRNVITEKVLERIRESAEIETVEKEQ